MKKWILLHNKDLSVDFFSGTLEQPKISAGGNCRTLWRLGLAIKRPKPPPFYQRNLPADFSILLACWSRPSR